MILQAYITLDILNSLDKGEYDLELVNDLVNNHNEIDSGILFYMWRNTVEFDDSYNGLEWEYWTRHITKENMLLLAKTLESINDNIGNQYFDKSIYIKELVRDYTMGLAFNGIDADKRLLTMRENLNELVVSLRKLAEEFPWECVWLRFVEEI